MNAATSVSRPPAWAFLLLLAGLLATAAAVRHEKGVADGKARAEFDAACREIAARVADRLIDHEQILRSGAGFFAQDDHVTRREWREFYERQKVSQKLPGIQGMGFAKLIPPAQLAAHVRAVRAEGFPDYQVRPPGERPMYSATVYLEPFSGRNLRAFGFDMLSEPVRRAAMERARDRDEAALTGKVRLVQETEKDVQAGTLMYVPVYRTGVPHATVAERRAALLGWVYSPYRMDDLMHGILERGGLDERGRIRLRIYDGEAATSEAQLYDSLPAGEGAPPSASGYSRRTSVESAGRRWLLRFDPVPGGAAAPDLRLAWLVAGGGTLISLLVAFLALTLADTRRAAEAQARRLTAELRQSEERWKFAIEGNGDGLWDWDIPAGKVFFSRRWKEMLGFSDAEVGNGFGEWESRVHPDDLSQALAAVKAAHDGRAPLYASECRLRCKDGSWKWILARGVVVQRAADGKPLRMIGTHADITERKEMEAARAGLQRLESLGVLAGGIAHDFNNILTAILGNLSLLDSKTSGGEARELLKEAQDACVTAAGLARQLLTFAKGGRPITTVQDLRPLVTQAAVFAARGSNARCVFDLGETPLAVKVDKDQIAQVVSNLVLNAAQAMPGGGDIEFRAATVALGEAELPPLAPGRYVRVTVADHGAGISPENLAKVFEPYFSTKATGRGLGLAVCHSILAKHGGDIRVASKPGAGAVFTLHFPAANAAEIPREAAPAPAPRGGGRVLVMDDEAPVARLVKRMLEQLGYEAETVADGKKALESYERALEDGRPFDAVIMDLTIPGGMGGREAGAKLLALHPEAKILVSSGYTDDAVMSDAAAHGFAAALVKPYRLEDVGAALSRVLGSA